MSLLGGRIALVTGAANGIGRAIAERFVAEGAVVVALDRDAVQERDGVMPMQFDLAETDALAGVIAEAERLAGPLDVLVNNAAIQEKVAAIDLTLETYRRVLAVNLDAAVLLSIAAARSMRSRRYGRIVNISSIHGRFGEVGALPYDVAKGGLDQATRTLAIELAPEGILVNAIAPGFVNTRMSSASGTNELESDWFRSVYVERGKIPLRRYAEPTEIAPHAAWLASEANTYMTGQVITVDGGMTVTF